MTLKEQELILDYLHGRPALDVERLNELLRTSAEARAFLRRVSAAEVRLRELALVNVEQQPATRNKAWTSWRSPLAWAASVALMAVSTWLFWPGSSVSQPQMATLISTVNARWASEAVELSLNAGEEPSGLLHLLAGQAEFSTAHGALVALEAPAVIRFESATVIFVELGKVFCRCPTRESRLTVRTPETKVIDLGTEFAVEARGDSSTRVAVLSGEVQVESTVLRQGQAAEVRSPGVTMLDASVAQEMMAEMTNDDAPRAGTLNALRDADFSTSQTVGWELSDHHTSVTNGALHVRSRGRLLWPNARQTVWRSDLNGRAVVASVRAMQAIDDPLRPMQFAVLKLILRGEHGSHMAYASRHFQFGGDPLGIFETAHVAAIAPPGTTGVSVELLLNARGEKSGSVIFDDAVLHIGEPYPDPAK